MIEEEQVAGTAARNALSLVLAYLAPQMIAFVLLLIASAFPYASFAHGLIAFSNVVSDQATAGWRMLVCAGALAIGVWLRLRFADRPARVALALYLGLFGLTGLWMSATSPNNLLQGLFWQGAQPLHFWWTLLVSAMAIYWLARRQLTPERAAKLLFALLIVILLRQTNFIESPFSPLFGFAGIGFLVFGLCWDALTRGAWVNHDSPGFRARRALVPVRGLHAAHRHGGHLGAGHARFGIAQHAYRRRRRCRLRQLWQAAPVCGGAGHADGYPSGKFGRLR